MSKKCRRPTSTGPCERVVANGGPCYQHGGAPKKPSDPALRREWARETASRLRQQANAAARPTPAGPPKPPPISDAQVAAIASTLNRHDVDYIVIGGIASQLHGAQVERTADADIVVRRDDGQLKGLSAALVELDARLRVTDGPPEGVEVPIDPSLFKQLITATFITKEGPLDVCFRPDGTEGYDDLVRHSETKDVLGVKVTVAALADVIRSKDAAGRIKDQIVLPALRRRLRQILDRDESR